MVNIHLHNDLGIRKAALKKIILNSSENLSEQELKERQFDKAIDLINRRGSVYSVDEAYFLVTYYVTSSDECILENEEDYSPVEVYQASQKESRLNRALKVIQYFTKFNA